jgi:diguanylate cyclase (GGDEF)-like protein
MIRVYTTNPDVSKAVEGAAGRKDYPFEEFSKIDTAEFRAATEELSILIFDLSCPEITTAQVLGLLDALDPDAVPPVLYILSRPDDIELIAQAGGIHNQDSCFLPLDEMQLAARLEVLTMLGRRRKLTLETAITDRLTGLYNRKYFLRRLEEEMYRSARYKYSVGVLLASVDFATSDSELTEQTGTIAIQEVAEFLKGRLRKSDIIARFKWDDFAFLLPDITREDSLLVAEDVKQKLENLPITAEDSPVSLQVALGHVVLPHDSLATAIEVMEALEECAFQAKTEGKPSFVSFNDVAKQG